MKITDEKLKELLVQPGLISEADFKFAQEESKSKSEDLIEILISKDLIKDEQLGQLIAGDINFPYINLRQEKIDESVLGLIPELVARSKGVIAFAIDKQGVKVGMINPEELEVRHLLEKRIGCKVIPYYITKQDFNEALPHYKASLKDEFNSILKKLRDETKTREERDETIVKMVDMLLEYGYQNKASDIHIEPYVKKIMVRFRIDGIMHDVLDMPKNLAEFILSRIKILAKMRTDEHRAAQDGKFRYQTSGKEMVDIRVSVVPVTQGENLVMRLLSGKSRQFNLSDLGLLNNDLEKVKRAIKSPHGMILVTGPTGSGKTTTLYAVLKILNKRDVNISTIEDPVEYDVEGVSQIQINPKTNLTFAKGLRAIVRQDPDIIMVGEIRDEETANIAINSALTGHLVLSTLHTNDAATTLPRLLDMDIEPFLITSTVNIVIAQRLVRKICRKCLTSYTLNKEDKATREIIEHEPHIKEIYSSKGYKDLNKVTLYKGNGCKVCGKTGYYGRIGIFEVLEMSDDIKKLVLENASSDKIMEAACKDGMSTMLEDGIEKVFNGITTLSEVIRVTKE